MGRKTDANIQKRGDVLLMAKFVDIFLKRERIEER